MENNDFNDNELDNNLNEPEINNEPVIEIPDINKNDDNNEEPIYNVTMNYGAPTTPIINTEPVVSEELKEATEPKKNYFNILIIAIVVIALGIGGYFFFKSELGKDFTGNIGGKNSNSILLKETTVEITGKGITLNEEKILIDKGGIYTVSGILNDGVIIIDTTSDVELILDNVTLTSTKEAGIISKNTGNLKLTMKSETTNKIIATGSKDYNSAIYSNGNLTITGTGALDITNNSLKGISTKGKNIIIESGFLKIISKLNGLSIDDKGGNITINGGNIYIDSEETGIYSNSDIIINNGTTFVMGSSTAKNTAINCDGKYQINGGKFVALGNGTMKLPSDAGTQKTVLFNLNNALSENITISLADIINVEVITFKPNRRFKTIIISTPKITNKTYKLYTGTKHEGNLLYGIFGSGNLKLGTEVEINKKTEFEVNSNVNWFGAQNK